MSLAMRKYFSQKIARGIKMNANFSSETAIVGIGATEFSKESGRTPMELAVEACEAALGDAGVDASDVDGIVTFSSEQNFEI